MDAVAAALAGYDIGQTVVVAGQACVAVEAMEGTDATIERAGAIMRTLEAEGEAATGVHSRSPADRGESCQAEPGYALRCAGHRARTIETMRLAGATCLSIEAGRTLIFDQDTVRSWPRPPASRSSPLASPSLDTGNDESGLISWA